MKSHRKQATRSQAPSMFRIVLAILMLAGVWIVVRRIRSRAPQTAQLSATNSQINSQPVSFSDRDTVDRNPLSTAAPSNLFGSDLDAPSDPYMDFLLSVNVDETITAAEDSNPSEIEDWTDGSADTSPKSPESPESPEAEFGLLAPIIEPPALETETDDERFPSDPEESETSDWAPNATPDKKKVRGNPFFDQGDQDSLGYDDHIPSPSDLEPRLPEHIQREDYWSRADSTDKRNDEERRTGPDTDSILAPIVPAVEVPAALVPAVEDAMDDESLPTWQLSLRDAIEIGIANAPDVQVAQYLPSITGTLVGIERGEFDPVVGVSVYGGQDERLARSEVETIGASTNFIENDFFQPLNGLNNLFVKQNFQSGGNYEFGYGTDYRRFFPVGRDLLLPSGWESTINFQFSQPLLRGRGSDVALRRVLVAKAQTAQAQFESQAEIREVVRDIELAYWQLSAAHARTQAAAKYVKLGLDFERQEDERLGIGLSVLPQKLQTRALLSEFNVAYEQAKRDTNIAEMRLRTAMGIAGQSFRHCQTLAGDLSNIDLPLRPDIHASVMPVSTDIDLAIARSMSRPIFGVPNAKIQAARHNLAASKNSLLPQVDATALYQKSGLDKGLDDSVSSLFNQRFDTWAVGVTLEQNVFRRSAKASVRRFQLIIGQEQAKIDAIANQVSGLLRQYKADVEGSYDTFQARKAQVNDLGQQVEALNELYKDDKVSLFQRLEITRTLQASEIEAVEVWGQMQAATALYRYARGDSPDDYGVPIQGHTCL